MMPQEAGEKDLYCIMQLLPAGMFVAQKRLRSRYLKKKIPKLLHQQSVKYTERNFIYRKERLHNITTFSEY